jgi:hypothetical protein
VGVSTIEVVLGAKPVTSLNPLTSGAVVMSGAELAGGGREPSAEL